MLVGLEQRYQAVLAVVQRRVEGVDRGCDRGVPQPLGDGVSRIPSRVILPSSTFIFSASASAAAAAASAIR